MLPSIGGAAGGGRGRMSIDVAPPERALGLAGSIIKGRYRINAVSSVTPDVVLYAAEELRHGRPITLEVLRDDLAADREFAAAVRDLAGTLAISAHAHRGVPRVYECGVSEGGDLFVALEPIKGTSVRDLLDAGGALDPATALRIASQVGEALETLHHDGIVHGRLSPESILLVKDRDGAERVSLVGIELTVAYRTSGGRRRAPSSPAYLAPEQVDGGETTGLSDQYALGLLLRELLTAESREGAGATTPPALPPEIDRIIATALEPRPWRRFPDISVMVNDIWAAHTALAEPMPRPRPIERRTNPHRRPTLRPAVAVRIAAAVATAGVVAGHRLPPPPR